MIYYVCFYVYHNVSLCEGVRDYSGGFVIACGGFSRLHLFTAANFNEIKQKILEYAFQFVGINIKVLADTITLDTVQGQRFGKFR